MMDRVLQQRVEDALDWEPRVDAAHVGVTAQDGVARCQALSAATPKRSQPKVRPVG